MAVTIDTLKKIIGKKNINKTRAFSWLSDLELGAGKLDEAFARINNGLALFPNDIAAMLVRAKLLLQKNECDKCVQECEKVLICDPFNLAAQRIMGAAYEKLENLTERNRCYSRIHDMDPLDDFWKEEYAVIVDTTENSGENLQMPDDVIQEDSIEQKSAEPIENIPQNAKNQPEQANENVKTVVANAQTSEQSSSFEDPFASLAAMLPNNDAANDSSVDNLASSLDSVMNTIDTVHKSPTETLPDGEELSGNDVGSALSQMFGAEDDLEPEEPVQAQTPQMDIPASIDDIDTNKNAANIFADKPKSVDSAFDSIFGEDELPEEPAKPKNSESLFEKAPVTSWSPDPLHAAPSELTEPVAQETAPVDASKETAQVDAPQSVDSAFDSIFGEDELPEEPAKPAKPENSESLFEKAPVTSWSPDPLHAAPSELTEPVAQETAPVDASKETAQVDAPQSVDSAFDSIFGEDELPEEPEKPENSEPAEADSLKEKVANADTELEIPELRNTDEVANNSLSNELDKSFENLFGDNDDLTLPNAETSNATEPSAQNTSQDSLDKVSGAFDVLFDNNENLKEDLPSNKGVDFLMSGDSDDEISASLVKNPNATLDSSSLNLDDSLNTRTLADIYLEQEHYDKALDIYKDLAQKNPEDAEIIKRLGEIQKLYDEKFGDNA